MPSYSSHPLPLLNPPPTSCHPSLALVRVHHPSAFDSPFEAAFDYNQSPALYVRIAPIHPPSKGLISALPLELVLLPPPAEALPPYPD